MVACWHNGIVAWQHGAKMAWWHGGLAPGGLDLLLLLPVLDGLGVDELLQLLLLGDQQVVLVGGGLRRHRVVPGRHVLAGDDGDGEGGGALGDLGLLPVPGLLRRGVEHRRHRLPVDHRHGEIGRGRRPAEGVVGAGGGAEPGGQLRLGPAGGQGDHSS